MPPKTSFARFTPFSRGKIVGKAKEGASTKAIRKTVLKKDGRLASLRAIDAVVAKANSDPSWQGEDSSAGGRPPAFTPSQVCELKKLIDDEVGLAKVTIPYMRKRLPFLRAVTLECVRLTLQRLGLAWRLRRRKAAVARKYKPDRLKYSRWVLKQPDAELKRWAYVDGTSIYLARTAEEHED